MDDVEKNLLTLENNSHKHRYPRHFDPGKGQIHGGICNRTACSGRRAEFWNFETFAFYCAHCARSINDMTTGGPILARLERKPTLAEMDDRAFRAAALSRAG